MLADLRDRAAAHKAVLERREAEHRRALAELLDAAERSRELERRLLVIDTSGEERKDAINQKAKDYAASVAIHARSKEHARRCALSVTQEKMLMEQASTVRDILVHKHEQHDAASRAEQQQKSSAEQMAASEEQIQCELAVEQFLSTAGAVALALAEQEQRGTGTTDHGPPSSRLCCI